MKHLSLAFLFSLLGLLPAQADTLLNYIEMPIESTNLLAFSGQGIKFKECSSCSITQLKPNSKVAFYEQNAPVNLKEATELFVGKKYDTVSIYYNRQTSKYDKVVFGGHIEIEPIQPHPNFQ